MRRILLAVIAICCCFGWLSPAAKAQCQSSFSTQEGYTPFDGGISYVAGPNEAGDYLVVGFMSLTNFQNLSTVPVPNSQNQRFCDTVPLSGSARYFAYVPTAPERTGNFGAFSGLIYDPTANCSPFPACAAYSDGVITNLPGMPSTNGVFAWRIPAGEALFVTTGIGGQILKVDGNSGAFQVVSNGPGCEVSGCFTPTGAVVGPDGKVYITDSVNTNIWRMNQDGSQLESIYNQPTCTARQGSPCPANPEGPSFGGSGNGDLYFNTLENGAGLFVLNGAATTPFGVPFNNPVSVEPCNAADTNCPFGGTGTAFDASGNLLAADEEDSEVWSLGPPYTGAPSAILNSSTTPVSINQTIGIALNKANGQVYLANSEGFNSQTDQLENDILQIVPPVLPSTAYTTRPYYTFTSTVPNCAFGSADLPEYLQFDMTGHSFVVTSTTPLSIDSPFTAQKGCGRVWRIDPTLPVTATLLLDLDRVFKGGIPGTCTAPCSLASEQAIGLGLPATAGPTQTVGLSASGGSATVGWPIGCTPTNTPGNNCSSTIGVVYPANMFGPGDMLNVTFNETSQQQFKANAGASPYASTTLAPVEGYNGNGIVPTLLCTNGGSPCSGTVMPGTSYNIFTTWQSNQTNYCSQIPHLLRGDPAGGPYTSLVDTLINCTDGGLGTKGQSSCSSTGNSSCLSDWPNTFGAVTGSTSGVTASAAITSPANGASFTLNQGGTAMFACAQTPTSPTILVSCPGVVTKPDGTIASVTSGGSLPSSLAGTYTLSVTPNVDGGSGVTSASVNYTVVACHDVSFAFNPDPVAVGHVTVVTATVESCTGTTQKNVVVQFTLTGPFGKSCGMSQTLMFKTPAFTLDADKDTFKFPLPILKGACAGTYTVTAQTFVSGALVDTSSSALVVTAH